MHSFGHIRPFAFGLPLIVAVVCALSSLGWGDCVPYQRGLVQIYGGDVGIQYCSNNSSSGYYGANICGAMSHTTTIYNGRQCYVSVGSFSHCASDYYAECVSTGTCCRTQVELDSVICLNSGSLWIDSQCCDEQCVCEKDGGQWVNGQCQPACNDHVSMPDKCEEIWKSGYSIDADGNPGGGGYWAITTYECFYDSCAMSLNCQEKSSFPAGSLNCGDFQDTTGTPGRCVGTVGFQCIMQCGTSTHNCDCDGSCQKALDSPDCGCPSSSSSTGSSSSGGSSSFGENSSSSGENSSSSGESSGSSSGSGGTSSGSGGDWEYNYHPELEKLISLNVNQVGYLSDIDRMVANINANGLKVDNSATVSAVAQATDAQKAGNDTLHSMHSTLDRIDSALNQNVEEPDISDWITSATSTADRLYSMANDTTTRKVHIDSVKADTSQFKSKYSGLFISNAYTRVGCYTWQIKDSGFMGKVGKQFKLGGSVDFSSLGGFDLCSILRGIVRAIGAILCLLITIKAYRSAFSSSDG